MVEITIEESKISGSTPLSDQIITSHQESIAGGDSSTMRVLPYHLPLVATKGLGSRLWDVDGNEYIDLNMAYGPLISATEIQRYCVP